MNAKCVCVQLLIIHYLTIVRALNCLSAEKKIRNHILKKKKGLENYEPVKILFIAVKFTLALVLAASTSSP